MNINLRFIESIGTIICGLVFTFTALSIIIKEKKERRNK